MLTFYFAPGSSSMAPHIALHEIGEAFDGRPVSFACKETRSPDFLALNPEGKVPMLLIDGRPLTEVAAILFYLARRYPNPHLLPTNIEAEAQVISWMSFIASTIHPARQRERERQQQTWDIAERRLGRHDWAVGQYSSADIHLFRLYWRFVGSASPDRTRFPRLSAHYDRMMTRPAVRRTCQIEAAIGYELPA